MAGVPFSTGRAAFRLRTGNLAEADTRRPDFRKHTSPTADLHAAGKSQVRYTGLGALNGTRAVEPRATLQLIVRVPDAVFPSRDREGANPPPPQV